MVTFQVKHTMDQQSWEDHVLGSGGFMWEWWVTVDEKETSDGLVGIEAAWYINADYPSKGIDSKFLTWQEIADACSELAETHELVAEQLLADDFDANGMDLVLQYAFIGEIRYA